jgi:hypothetical protein
MPLYVLHILLTVLVQIANKMGLLKLYSHENAKIEVMAQTSGVARMEDINESSA